MARRAMQLVYYDAVQALSDAAHSEKRLPPPAHSARPGYTGHNEPVGLANYHAFRYLPPSIQ